MCQNPLLNKITPATDICDRGDFHIFGVLTHPLFRTRLIFILFVCYLTNINGYANYNF